MHERQLNPPPNRTRYRVLVALVAAVSMLATGGLGIRSAEAQGAAQFVFEGAGWGHGVGMSQNGARNAANGGADHVSILNFYYPNTIVTQVAPLENIRVHIGDASTVEMSSAGAITFERGGVPINAIPSGSITVSAHDGGLQIGNAWTTGSPSDPLYVSFPQPMKISNNGHRYLWGKIQLTNKNGKVRVVEVLPLEKYVAGIAEMPAAWPLEALMAQAIAARTYAHEITLHRRNSTEWAQEYDISGSTVDQNYIGYDAQDSAWDQKWLAAVSATAGVEIVDGNGPIRAYYSASNGGYTETAAYVFDNDVPYTVAGPDPYDEGGHDWTSWTRTYTQQSISRWLNAHPDTAVGTLTAINVLGGHGASARLDKAVVELVGTSGTKRVTGKRLMLVMNAGIFGEGGGLSTHLPGTFTTIGNGVSAGPPVPSGAPIVAEVTPDPVPEGVSVNAGFTPPPGWQPEPGTGVPPGRGVAPSVANKSDNDADNDAENEGAAGAEADRAEADGGVAGRFTPPPGWQPEPGTGVPPGRGVAPSVANESENDADNDADNEGADRAEADGGVTHRFTLPPGWQPEPGTGVPPGRGVPPTPSATTQSAPSTPSTPSTPPPSTQSTSSTPSTPAETTLTGTAATVTGSADATAAAAAAFVPPEDWEPEEATGVAPRGYVGGTGGGVAGATGVFLVTRTADGAEFTETDFRVLAPTQERSPEAKVRVADLQTRAVLGLFADLDIDGYVASVAPRPVHAVCTATPNGITCVPLAALRDDDQGGN